jgi:hypothetical protein
MRVIVIVSIKNSEQFKERMENYEPLNAHQFFVE